jgi:hypothetical protein
MIARTSGASATPYTPSFSRVVPGLVRSESLCSRQNEGEHLTRPHFMKCRGTRFERAAGRSNIVDQEHACSADEIRLSRGERAAQIRTSRMGVERRLSRRIAQAHEPTWKHSHLERSRNRGREQRRLVVATFRKTSWMERNRHHEIDCTMQAIRRLEHRVPEARREVGAIFVFESCDRRC